MRYREETLQPHHIDQEISKMSENMIGHGRGLQNEFIKLANGFPKDGEEIQISCIKGFREERNPHTSNATKNSFNLCMQSIFPVRTAADSSHHTHASGRGKKVKIAW